MRIGRNKRDEDPPKRRPLFGWSRSSGRLVELEPSEQFSTQQEEIAIPEQITTPQEELVKAKHKILRGAIEWAGMIPLAILGDKVPSEYLLPVGIPSMVGCFALWAAGSANLVNGMEDAVGAKIGIDWDKFQYWSASGEEQ